MNQQRNLFHSRIGQAQMLFYVVLNAGLSANVIPIAGRHPIGAIFTACVCYAAICLFSSPRFHDMGISGKNTWKLLIPGYHLYLLGVLLMKKGDNAPNAWGEPRILKKYERVALFIAVIFLLVLAAIAICHARQLY
jgi:hypothetical protein